MSFEPPKERDKLIRLMEEIDRQLPACSDTAYQMVAYIHHEDLLRPIRQGRLVVISRGMFREILRHLQDATQGAEVSEVDSYEVDKEAEKGGARE